MAGESAAHVGEAEPELPADGLLMTLLSRPPRLHVVLTLVHPMGLGWMLAVSALPGGRWPLGDGLPINPYATSTCDTRRVSGGTVRSFL